MRARRFVQCDVFASAPATGAGLAVVIDGENLSDMEMQAFASWTNLAETTFLMPPTTAEADYKVRIFTPKRELPFAGFPTLGSCAAWLHSGGKPRSVGLVRQECGVGIVDVDAGGSVLAFAAPRTTVMPLEPETLLAVVSALGIAEDCVRRSARLSNGPVWQVLELSTAEDVLAVDPSRIRPSHFPGLGLFGAHPAGSECQFETRNLGPNSGTTEDPITGSLNAAIAWWMYGAGNWRAPVTIGQGTALGRNGRLFCRRDDMTGVVWVAGQTWILIEGTLSL
jgi:PhzF family phenazine biosynthesis protein